VVPAGTSSGFTMAAVSAWLKFEFIWPRERTSKATCVSFHRLLLRPTPWKQWNGHSIENPVRDTLIPSFCIRE
jgi:hypothetical protein